MKFSGFISCLLLLAAVPFAVARAACGQSQEVVTRGGECLLADDVRIVCAPADIRYAGVLQKEVFDRCGVIIPVTDMRGTGGAVVLERVSDMAGGGYVIDISSGGITCRASSDDGFRQSFKVLAALLQVRDGHLAARCAVISYDPSNDTACRSFDRLYAKYKGRHGYTAVHVTGAMLKTAGLNGLGVSGIMTVSASGRNAALEADFRSVIKSGGYDMLVDNTDGDRCTVIYAKGYPAQDGRYKSEVLIFSLTDNTDVVSIRGRLDIRRITQLPFVGK